MATDDALEQQEGRAIFASLFPDGTISLPINVDEFAAETAKCGDDVGERLRWLAIWLEEEFLTSWSVLHEVYEAAFTRTSRQERILHSWAIAAIHYADISTTDSERGELLDEARSVLDRALCLEPNNADACYAMGLALYGDDRQEIGQAESWFRKALASNPAHTPARLYIGYCLKDRHHWQEALEHFRKIDETQLREAFHPSQTWRWVMLKEQMTYCAFKSGRSDDARAAFCEFLDAFEKRSREEVEFPAEAIETIESSGIDDSFLNRFRAALSAKGWSM